MLELLYCKFRKLKIISGSQSIIISNHSKYLQFMEKRSKANPIVGQTIPVRDYEFKENCSLPQCSSSVSSSLSEVGIKL